MPVSVSAAGQNIILIIWHNSVAFCSQNSVCAYTQTRTHASCWCNNTAIVGSQNQTVDVSEHSRFKLIQLAHPSRHDVSVWWMGSLSLWGSKRTFSFPPGPRRWGPKGDLQVNYVQARKAASEQWHCGSELCASTWLSLGLLLRNINVPYGHPMPSPGGTVGTAARRGAAGLQLWGQRASTWLLFPAGRWSERQADKVSHSPVLFCQFNTGPPGGWRKTGGPKQGFLQPLAVKGPGGYFFSTLQLACLVLAAEHSPAPLQALAPAPPSCPWPRAAAPHRNTTERWSFRQSEHFVKGSWRKIRVGLKCRWDQQMKAGAA